MVVDLVSKSEALIPLGKLYHFVAHKIVLNIGVIYVIVNPEKSDFNR